MKKFDVSATVGFEGGHDDDDDDESESARFIRNAEKHCSSGEATDAVADCLEDYLKLFLHQQDVRRKKAVLKLLSVI